MPVPSRPPLTSTSKRPSRLAASIASTQHWRPNRSAISVSSSGRSTAAVLTETLSAPASSRCQRVVHRAHAAADGQRDRQHLAHPAHRLVLVAAPFGRGRDVEDDDLVGALVLVEPGPLGRVAGVAQALELHALDHAAMADVEAGDDARGQHQASSRKRDEQRLAVGAGQLRMELAADHVAALHGGDDTGRHASADATAQPGASVAR